MKNSHHKKQQQLNSIVPLPDIFDRNIEDKLSDQAHKSYVSKLVACRQFVERHFQKNYGIPAYPVCDMLLALEVSDLRTISIESMAIELAMPLKVLQRYLAIAERHKLIIVNANAEIPEISLAEKGVDDLLLITNAISEVAFKLRPLDSTNR
ncbi:MAG: hypothetical protein Pars92KO_12670 [Parasphingorhabdus sp.]